MVIRKHQGQYAVAPRGYPDGTMFICEVSSTLRKRLIYRTTPNCKHPPTDPAGCPRCRPLNADIHRHVQVVADIHEVDPLAIGDMVGFEPAGDRGMIVEILPRRNTLTRRAAGFKPLRQIIAANVDQVFAVMAAAQPHPSWEFMDRYLAAAEEAEIPACVLITKMDLADRGRIEADVEVYRGIGYPVLLTSATTGEGIEELRRVLRGRLSVFAGKSGVGKTTILNLIQPELGLRVARVSERGPQAGKGRHTTTHVELFPLDGGGSIVDTPGMREFGLWDRSSARQEHEHEALDVAELFPDLRPFVGRCRFGLDCSHAHEPGCAIRAAVDGGQIHPRRYRNYLRISGNALSDEHSGHAHTEQSHNRRAKAR